MRIFVIGQNPEFAEFVDFHLDVTGGQVVAGVPGAGLLEDLHRINPDIVLLHFDSLGVQTMQVCAQLKSALVPSVSTVAIATDGDSKHSDALSFYSCGADAVLENALNSSLLIARLRALFRPHSRRLQTERAEVAMATP